MNKIRYTKQDTNGRYYIESVNGKLESNVFGHTYGAAIDRFAELERADIGKLYNEIRAEAIKEFAERLKEKAYPFPCAVGVEYAVTIRAINDLVKEMTGNNDG